MIRPILALAVALAISVAPSAVLAQSTTIAGNDAGHAHGTEEDHEDEGHEDHDHHAVGAGELTVTHPWARAAEAGGSTMVFLEIENEGETDTLEGAEAAIAAGITIVGFSMVDGRQSYTEIGPVEIDEGSFAFDPFGLALELSGLSDALTEGESFALILDFAGAGALEVMVEVEAADAIEHSHAGHAH